MILPHLYLQTGREQGVPAPALDQASKERAFLQARGTYPVLSLGHLAHETGASYSYLREVVSRTRDPYRSISIPKPSGGSRAISAPDPIIADVQRWILANPLGNLGRQFREFCLPARSLDRAMRRAASRGSLDDQDGSPQLLQHRHGIAGLRSFPQSRVQKTSCFRAGANFHSG